MLKSKVLEWFGVITAIIYSNDGSFKYRGRVCWIPFTSYFSDINWILGISWTTSWNSFSPVFLCNCWSNWYGQVVLGVLL